MLNSGSSSILSLTCFGSWKTSSDHFCQLKWVSKVYGSWWSYLKKILKSRNTSYDGRKRHYKSNISNTMRKSTSATLFKFSTNIYHIKINIAIVNQYFSNLIGRVILNRNPNYTGCLKRFYHEIRCCIILGLSLLLFETVEWIYSSWKCFSRIFRQKFSALAL